MDKKSNDRMGRLDTATVGPDLELDFNNTMERYVAPGIVQMIQTFGTLDILHPNSVVIDMSGLRSRARQAIDELDAAAGKDNAAFLAAAVKLAAAGVLMVYMRTKRRN